ncbi:MAG: O-acetyl-ADP-ribose deacetylase [Bacteroidota bacterium]
MKNKIKIIQGDITKVNADAIVNAANKTLLGGGGVDGAIHRAAGKQLLEECKTLGGCSTGEAKITNGYNLPARYVIHTVGPVWNNGKYCEDELLANCYRNSLQLASENKIHTIAFPAISTGIYRFPLERATRIAMNETKSFLCKNLLPEKIIFLCFDEKIYSVYQKIFTEIFL